MELSTIEQNWHHKVLAILSGSCLYFKQVSQGTITEDVSVLDVIGGRYFWAYVGDKCVETVGLLSSYLQQVIFSLPLVEQTEITPLTHVYVTVGIVIR
jgi:hypothetical protein